jgi:hypothetical protein
MFFKVERTEPHDIFCIKILFCPIDNKILLSIVRPAHVQYSYPHLPSFHSPLLTLIFRFISTVHFQIHTPPSSPHYVLFLPFLIFSHPVVFYLFSFSPTPILLSYIVPSCFPLFLFRSLFYSIFTSPSSYFFHPLVYHIFLVGCLNSSPPPLPRVMD